MVCPSKKKKSCESESGKSSGGEFPAKVILTGGERTVGVYSTSRDRLACLMFLPSHATFSFLKKGKKEKYPCKKRERETSE